jgi:hypothetical protein
MSSLPTQEFLREWLHYNPDTGIFVWLKEPRKIGPVLGKVAGTSTRKYVMIKLPGFRSLGAHRIAWIYVHGLTIGGAEVDHKDGDPSNNAISNLRLANSSQQKQNKGVQSNNRSGLKGAYYHACHKGKKWRSQIKVGNVLIFLGYFHTAQEAHEAYVEAAQEHFGSFARAA